MNDHRPSLPTVGILYPGELGASLARRLGPAGFRTVTTLAGRSPRTQALCRAAGLEVFGSLAEVAQAAEIVISLVPPRAAIDNARAYLAARSVLSPPAVYVDANSVSPETALVVARMVEDEGLGFVDAAVHGLAANLDTQATLYLSGEPASDLGKLFQPALCVRDLGPVAGQASLLKMLLGGVSKGLVALLLEIATTARQADMQGEFLSACGHYYPGVLEILERLLPTYPLHVARRADEMRELEQTIATRGSQPGLIRETQALLARLARSNLAATAASRETAPSGLSQWIDLFVEAQPLVATAPPAVDVRSWSAADRAAQSQPALAGEISPHA